MTWEYSDGLKRELAWDEGSSSDALYEGHFCLWVYQCIDLLNIRLPFFSAGFCVSVTFYPFIITLKREILVDIGEEPDEIGLCLPVLSVELGCKFQYCSAPY